MHVTFRNREYVIEKRLGDKTIRIKDVVTDERTAVPEQELVNAIFESGAQLNGHDRNQDHRRDLDDHDQENADRFPAHA